MWVLLEGKLASEGPSVLRLQDLGRPGSKR